MICVGTGRCQISRRETDQRAAGENAQDHRSRPVEIVSSFPLLFSTSCCALFSSYGIQSCVVNLYSFRVVLQLPLGPSKTSRNLRRLPSPQIRRFSLTTPVAFFVKNRRYCTRGFYHTFLLRVCRKASPHFLQLLSERQHILSFLATILDVLRSL